MALPISLHIFIFLLPNFIMAMGGVPSLNKQAPRFLEEAEELTLQHYARTCPSFEAIVHSKVKDWIAKDYTLAASLIRLHFHDCAIRVHSSLSLSSLS